VLCCAIKPLCAWNAEDCATTCRERCGGQGYLSVNRFGALIGFAHAGMTAEGDNRWAQSAAWWPCRGCLHLCMVPDLTWVACCQARAPPAVCLLDQVWCSGAACLP
jgi:hypothetical protein